MDLRTLESYPYETLHAAFLDAFADYAIRFDMSLEQLEEMHRRRGVRLDLSVGAFDGDKLVGFTFNGLGRWKGRTAGYDSGTGVAPSARGRRLASEMMQRSLELLGAAGATSYVLEVLQTNVTAFRVYEKIGFRVTRDFCTWKLDRVTRPPDPGIAIETTSGLDDIPVETFWDWLPSWQHSVDSLKRASEPKTVLVAGSNGRVDGYAVYFESGDLAQFAVARDKRRQNVGTTLLHAARERCAKPLRIVNTDAGDTGITRFLEAIGAIETVRQHEMVLENVRQESGPAHIQA